MATEAATNAETSDLERADVGAFTISPDYADAHAILQLLRDQMLHARHIVLPEPWKWRVSFIRPPQHHLERVDTKERFFITNPEKVAEALAAGERLRNLHFGEQWLVQLEAEATSVLQEMLRSGTCRVRGWNARVSVCFRKTDTTFHVDLAALPEKVRTFFDGGK